MRTIKVPADLAQRLVLLAKAKGTTASDIIEVAVVNTFGQDLKLIDQLIQPLPDDLEANNKSDE